MGPDQGRVKYSEYLRELVKKYHLEGSVAFYGQTSDVSALMMVSNVVLSTAIEPEAFGRISIEGQAMGKVVVASNIGGSLDTITDGVTGKFFYSNNPGVFGRSHRLGAGLVSRRSEKNRQSGNQKRA